VIHDKAVAANGGPYDWSSIARSLDAHGNAVLPHLLSAAECTQLIGMYEENERYRTRIVMAKHGFGSGEYKYFSYPLPDLVAKLREELYRALAPIANRWNEALAIDVRYPRELPEFIARCHAAGQQRPTPLILKYGVGDYNCLHQDLYGEHVFPLQVAILLTQPGTDFDGGEFVMTETGPKEQRAEVVALSQGDAVIFTVNARPAIGARRMRKVSMRHGVNRILRGHRNTVGLIFHDSK
jgi:hypothetical protein